MLLSVITGANNYETSWAIVNLLANFLLLLARQQPGRLEEGEHAQTRGGGELQNRHNWVRAGGGMGTRHRGRLHVTFLSGYFYGVVVGAALIWLG